MGASIAKMPERREAAGAPGVTGVCSRLYPWPWGLREALRISSLEEGSVQAPRPLATLGSGTGHRGRLYLGALDVTHLSLPGEA